MTSMKKAVKIEQEALDFGFDWPNYQMILDQIISECQEVSETITENQGRERLQEEIGDLMLATVELCMFFKLDPEEVLDKSADKFKKRLDEMMGLVRASGRQSLRGESIEVALDFWRQAKKKLE